MLRDCTFTQRRSDPGAWAARRSRAAVDSTSGYLESAASHVGSAVLLHGRNTKLRVLQALARRLRTASAETGLVESQLETGPFVALAP
jgi:hypothetical protein